MPPDSFFDTLPPAAQEKLLTHEALLRKWQKTINLVGPGTIPALRERHTLDSLQLLPLLPGGAATLYDLGAGAGFPGLVLAMARPGLAVTLVESDERKAAFLATVSRESKTPATVLARRIEDVVPALPAPDVVTARALAPLDRLLLLVHPWAAANPDMACLFPKGRTAQDEIAAARKLWAFDSRETESVTDPGGTILTITALRPHDESV